MPVESVYSDLVGRLLDLTLPVHIETDAKGTSIISEGDDADKSLLLLEGWLAFTKMLPEGETQIIDIMLPGDFAILGSEYAPVSACSLDCLSDVRYLSLPSSRLNRDDPNLIELRKLMAAMIVATQARTAELVLRKGNASAANRTAYALLELFVRLQAINHVQDKQYHFPITQQQLGEFVGLSNVHVCRTMRRFERSGLISHPDSTHVKLDDIDALCEIAGIDLEVFANEILVRRPA